MTRKHLLVASGLTGGLLAWGYLLFLFSAGWNQNIDWMGTVFEALLFVFVFSWNLVILPHWRSSKTLSLGSLLFLGASFTDLHDEFFAQPRWVNWFVEDPAFAAGSGLIGLGIWFWVKEKERLLEQLRKERDFEASLIPKLSHDLRVPLTNLVGMNSIMEEDPTFLENPKSRNYFETIWRASREMGLLIDNILETHRMKSGTVVLTPEPVSLIPLLEEVCGDFHYQAKKKELALVKDCGPEEIVVEADRAKVARIIQNLLANAVKFSTQGGKIVIKVDCQNSDVIIRVQDEGPGMSEEEISAILQGVPKPRTKITRGAEESFGIGLKVVREFVQLHGGRFWIEPNLPTGTRFCFSLPLRQTDAKPKL